jgi:hypothetical protein
MQNMYDIVVLSFSLQSSIWFRKRKNLDWGKIWFTWELKTKHLSRNPPPPPPPHSPHCLDSITEETTYLATNFQHRNPNTWRCLYNCIRGAPTTIARRMQWPTADSHWSLRSASFNCAERSIDKKALFWFRKAHCAIGNIFQFSFQRLC